MYKLKPCPFCGSEAKTNVHYWKCGGNNELGLVAEVKCDNCDVSQFADFEGNNKSFNEYITAFNTVVEKWNTRI